jgi:hypothetical protein
VARGPCSKGVCSADSSKPNLVDPLLEQRHREAFPVRLTPLTQHRVLTSLGSANYFKGLTGSPFQQNACCLFFVYYPLSNARQLRR